MEQINLNIIPSGMKPVCHVSQNDKGRVIRFNLYDGNARKTLISAESVEINMRKPDGTVVTAQVPHLETNYIDLELSEQMCTCPGLVECNLKISVGVLSVNTLNFFMDVEEDPLNNGTQSASSIYDLQSQIEEIISHMPISSGGVDAINLNFHIGERS